jgi:hypothetical protein
VSQREIADDMLARSPGLVLPPLPGSNGEPGPEDFEKILAFGDDRIERKPEDYYAFRMIVSSDGLDSFFTKPDPETSLPNYADDLKHGQALLGSHQTNTFSYGVSYDGELLEADPSRKEYEKTFFRRFADKAKHATTKWAIGKYAIPRGFTVNGQSSDDLIRGIQMGALRRVSISFTVGQYKCGICSNDMIAGFFGPEGDGPCRHMPGVDYKDDGVGWALMRDNDLHESSLVFKNSSPSAMILRKAEAMAQRGMITERDIVRLEERFAHRLPRHETRLWVGDSGTTSSTTVSTAGVLTIGTAVAAGSTPVPDPGKEKEMTEKRHEGHFHVGLNVDAEDIKGGHGADYEGDPGDEANDPEAAAEMLAPGILEELKKKEAGDTEDGAEAPVDEKAASAEVESRHEGHTHEGDSKGGHFKTPPKVTVKTNETFAGLQIGDEVAEMVEDDEKEEKERMAQSRAMARDVLGRLAAVNTRDRQISEILGEPVTVEAIQRQARDAELGRNLYSERVERAVKARISVDGEKFNADKWRALLMGSRDIELVQAEIDSWEGRRDSAYTPGRQVVPAPLPDKKSERQQAQSNIVEPLTKR